MYIFNKKKKSQACLVEKVHFWPGAPGDCPRQFKGRRRKTALGLVRQHELVQTYPGALRKHLSLTSGEIVKTCRSLCETSIQM